MSYESFIKSQSYVRQSPNLSKLGFDFSNHDSKAEYQKIHHLLSTEYLILGESMLTLQAKYDIPSARTLHDLFKLFEIEARSFSNANRLALTKKRATMPCCYKYKTGWHTTWDQKQVFLRSSYEFDYAKILDELKTPYEVEALRIKYYSTNEGKYRIAVPDFLLPCAHTIVEIKSLYTYDRQQMKDKFCAYQALGYKTILVLEGKETPLE